MLTDSQSMARKAMVARGIVPLIVDPAMLRNSSMAIEHGLDYAKSLKLCQPGDVVVVVGAGSDSHIGHQPSASAAWVQFHSVK